MGSYANIIRESSSSILGDNIELDLPVLEGYGCSDGYLLSMAECLYNENVDFANSMECEFREAAMEMRKAELEASGAVEEAASIEVLTESTSDIIGKLSALISKLAAKIHSIYEAVKTRITSLLTKDYTKFYNSNKDKFNKKYKNFKGNIKWMQPTSAFKGGLKFNNITNRIGKEFTGVVLTKTDDVDNSISSVKDGTYLDNILCDIVPNTDRKSFKKDFKDFLFVEKDKLEDISSDIADEVNKVLGTNDIVKNLTDSQKNNKDLFKKVLSQLDNIKKEVNKGGSATTDIEGIKKVGFSSDYKGDAEKITLLRARVLALQTACNMVNGEYISLTKSHIAQCKAVFTKVCASATVSEQTLLDSIEEYVYDEVLESIELV